MTARHSTIALSKDSTTSGCRLSEQGVARPTLLSAENSRDIGISVTLCEL